MTTAPTTPPAAANGFTVPRLAKEFGHEVDRLRLLIRRNKTLQGMFTRIGPTRVLPAERLDEFKAALSGCSAGPGATCPPSSGR